MNTETFTKDGICWPIVADHEDYSGEFEKRYRSFQTGITQARGRECHIKPHLVSTWLDDIVHNEAVLDATEQAIGPDILLWSSDFAVKKAGAGTWVPWHQDTPYWNLSTQDVVSVWFAITPSQKSNGAMRIVPGTHVQGALGRINYDGDPHKGIEQGERTASKGNVFFYDHIMNEQFDESLARDVALQPGEFSIHHIQLLHGGGPNESEQDRIGFVMRFISAKTFCNSGMDSAMLVRGQYHGDQFHLEPRCDEDFSNTSVDALEFALSFPSGFGDRDTTKGTK